MALAMAISLSLQEQGGSQQVVSASSDQRNSQNNSSGSSSSQSMFGFGGTRSTQYISVGDEPEIAMSSHQPTVVSAVALPAHDQNGSGWMNPSASMDNHAAAAAAISTDNSPNSNGSGYFDDLSLARMLQVCVRLIFGRLFLCTTAIFLDIWWLMRNLRPSSISPLSIMSITPDHHTDISPYFSSIITTGDGVRVRCGR